MILSSLELNSFRNYVHESIQFDKKNNIISGKNAQGKTNLLEAIYLLCISKSFRTRFERETINFDHKFCIAQGDFCLDNGPTKRVIFNFTEDEGKQISVNRKKIHKLSEFIGQFPVVLSSPEEYNITSGPPSERRKFVDILLSQINITYINNLQDYYRIIKQRNKILNDQKFTNYQIQKLLEPWNESLVEKGSRIIWERFTFTQKFSDLLKNVYNNLNPSKEILNFKYNANVEIANLEAIIKNYQEKLSSLQKLEIKYGTTLLGPHRDDFTFMIDNKELRKFGSRGQHKTVLIALCIAEFKLLKEKLNETPIILIDDLFSEIDKLREERIMMTLMDLGQTFITTTIEIDELNKYLHNQNKYFIVDNGLIRIFK